MRLIDADKLKKHYEWWKDGTEEHTLDEMREIFNTIVDLQPTIDPVKRGAWEITEAYPHNVYCSVCHKRYAQTHWAVWEDGSLPRAYCPNCGAKMDAEEADHASL